LAASLTAARLMLMIEVQVPLPWLPGLLRL